jgi:hypothetical protein
VTPKPKDARWIGPWEDGKRLFDGQSWTVAHTTYNGRPHPITVAVIGEQYDDGHVQRRIVVDVPGDPITPAEARQVIAALTEAVAMSDTESSTSAALSSHAGTRPAARSGASAGARKATA